MIVTRAAFLSLVCCGLVRADAAGWEALTRRVEEVTKRQATAIEEALPDPERGYHGVTVELEAAPGIRSGASGPGKEPVRVERLTFADPDAAMDYAVNALEEGPGRVMVDVRGDEVVIVRHADPDLARRTIEAVWKGDPAASNRRTVLGQRDARGWIAQLEDDGLPVQIQQAAPEQLPALRKELEQLSKALPVPPAPPVAPQGEGFAGALGAIR